MDQSIAALPASPETNSTKVRSLSHYWLPAALLLAIFALAMPVAPSSDLWWHLGTGKYILQNKTVPHADPFSWTAAGKPWIAHEWLSDLLFYAVYALAGSAGLLLLTAGVIALAFYFTYLRCVHPRDVYPRKPGETAACIFALGLGMWAALPTFLARPQVFTFLFASVFLFLLDRYQRRPASRTLLVLPLLTLLWVNLHGAYILGPALILLAVTGTLLDRIGQARQAEAAASMQPARGLLPALLGCVIVVPLNPNGLKMYAYPFATLRSSAMQSRITEWASPDFHLPMFYPLAALLFLAVAAFALAPRRPRPSQVLLFCVFGLATLRSMRHLPIFVLVAVPLLAEYLWLPAWPWPKLSAGLQRTLKIAAVSLAAAFCAQSVSRRIADEPQIEREHFPVAAASYFLQNQLPGPIFNSYDFGGFLIWKLYPHTKVFIDGRADLYGDEFLQNFIRVYEVRENPAPVLDGNGIRTVIVEPGSALAAFLRGQSQWKRVYEDQLSVIFTR